MLTRLTITLLGVVTAAAALGCAGPLDGERDAFDRPPRHIARPAYASEAERRGDTSRERAAAPLPAEPTLLDYLRYAAAHNPGLEAAFHDWQAALHRVPQARALADPELSYRYVIHAMNERQAVGLSQMLPWYGRLRAGGDAATARARAAEARFDVELRRLRYEVKTAWAEYAYLARALAVMRESLAIAEQLEAAARSRFEAGGGAWADVVQAQLAAQQLADEIETLAATREPTVAQLNAALGRRADLPLPWPGRAPSMREFALDEATLLARLAEANPELAALAHDTVGERHELRVARLNRVPELMLGVEYMQMPDAQDAVGLMASINLPVWGGRTSAERAEALARFGAASLRRSDRLYELQADARLAWSRHRDARRRVERYDETLIPMAHEALAASETAYAQGAVAFEAISRAQAALQELRLTRERLAVDAFDAAARIEQLIGGAVTEAAGRAGGVRTDGDGSNLDAEPESASPGEEPE
ncbi:MAG: TolC family protein [Phycisphaeraceae bacterium]